MHIPTNYSAEEIVKYFIHEDLRGLFEGLIQRIADLEKEVTALEKSNELAGEQVSFARDLIEGIDHHVERNTKFTAFKKAYRIVRGDSSFEC